MRDADPLIGCVVAERYEIVRLLGRGGMGSVYEVRHLMLGRSFALKTMSMALAGKPDALHRFQREAQTVAALRHPGIVEVVGWESLPDGSPCMVMELLRGEDLSARIAREGPLGWTLIRELSDQILAGLEVAHRAGVVHRDLKPANVFLSIDDAGNERVKLLDFGVAKAKGSLTALTGDDSLIGTPAYMSPELAGGHGSKAGPEVDVWALGVILYQMATARLPFGGNQPLAMLHQICSGEPTPLVTHRGDAPPAFAAMVMRAITRDPGRRIVALDALRRELDHALPVSSGKGQAIGGGLAARLRVPSVPPPGLAAAPVPARPVGGTLAARLGNAGTLAPSVEPAWPEPASDGGVAGGSLAVTLPRQTSGRTSPLLLRAAAVAGVLLVLGVGAILAFGLGEPARSGTGEPIVLTSDASGEPAAPPSRPRWSIQLVPADAVAKLDGVAFEGPQLPAVSLDDGKEHWVTCEKRGHAPDSVRLSETTPPIITCSPRRIITRAVKIVSVPPEAPVFDENDVEIGTTPFDFYIAKGTRRELVVRAPDAYADMGVIDYPVTIDWRKSDTPTTVPTVMLKAYLTLDGEVGDQPLDLMDKIERLRDRDHRRGPK